MHCVIETEHFVRAAKASGMSDDEKHQIISTLAENPMAGDLIVGTGGARKVRFPMPGRGKRSGYRVVTYFAGDDIPVFLMDVYAKGERIDLTQSERNALRKMLGTVADDYRRSTSEKVKGLRKEAS